MSPDSTAVGPGGPDRLGCIVRRSITWFRTHARDLPWRRTRDPYGIWVSEIMLQQTQVKTVIPYWERWMRALPTVEALARAKPEAVLKLWEGLGYYSRARHLHAAARRIVEEQGGRFPHAFDVILALPGVGRYTAGAICSIAFNQPTPILDGNLIRVLTRLFCIRDNPKTRRTTARLWRLAELLVQHAARLQPSPRNPVPKPRDQNTEDRGPLESSLRNRVPQPPRTPLRLRPDDTCSHLNQALMELGAVLCTPRQPRCPECPLRRVCQAFQQGCAPALPRLGRRPAAIRRHVVAFVLEQRGRFLVRQRPAGVVNAQLWEFPNVEIHGAVVPTQDVASAPPPAFPKRQRISATRPAADLGAPPVLRTIARRTWGLKLDRLEPLCVLQHSITRSRIFLEVFRGKMNGFPMTRGNGLCWVPRSKLPRLPFTAAHRKICARLRPESKERSR